MKIISRLAEVLFESLVALLVGFATVTVQVLGIILILPFAILLTVAFMYVLGHVALFILQAVS